MENTVINDNFKGTKEVGLGRTRIWTVLKLQHRAQSILEGTLQLLELVRVVSIQGNRVSRFTLPSTSKLIVGLLWEENNIG